MPTACTMRPQLGSPPCSAALTSGELATARAAPSTLSPWPPRTTTRPMRLAPSPSRTTASASWRRSASSAWPKRSSSSDSASTATPLAPEHMRIAVSLVESWPSTEMRSNERLRQTPSSRSAVSRRQRGVGLHEAQHRREGRRDHPGALGLRAQAHGPAGQLDLEARALLERVGGHDRRARSRRRRRRAARRARAPGR